MTCIQDQGVRMLDARGRGDKEGIKKEKNCMKCLGFFAGDRQLMEGTLCYPSPGAGAAPGRRITQGSLYEFFVSQWEVNNGDI